MVWEEDGLVWEEDGLVWEEDGSVGDGLCGRDGLVWYEDGLVGVWRACLHTGLWLGGGGAGLPANGDHMLMESGIQVIDETRASFTTK